MFDSFGQPMLNVDALGTVRNAAGFDTGLRVHERPFETPRVLCAGGFDSGLTLHDDRLFNRWQQPLPVTINRYEPPAFKPLELPVFKPFEMPKPTWRLFEPEPVSEPFEFGLKKWW